MSHERFLEATGAAKWATIDELVAMLDDADYWEEEFIQGSLDMAKKAAIRGTIAQLKDANGWPVFASVVQMDDDGNKVRIYKQESFFDPDDYYQVTTYHVGLARHHSTKAKGYAKRAQERYGMQIPLPDMFPERVTSGD